MNEINYQALLVFKYPERTFELSTFSFTSETDIPDLQLNGTFRIKDKKLIFDNYGDFIKKFFSEDVENCFYEENKEDIENDVKFENSYIGNMIVPTLYYGIGAEGDLYTCLGNYIVYFSDALVSDQLTTTGGFRYMTIDKSGGVHCHKTLPLPIGIHTISVDKTEDEKEPVVECINDCWYSVERDFPQYDCLGIYANRVGWQTCLWKLEPFPSKEENEKAIKEVLMNIKNPHECLCELWKETK